MTPTCSLVPRLTHETTEVCSKCGSAHGRINQRYCAVCHAEYQRMWRQQSRQKNISTKLRLITSELRERA